MRRRPRLVTWLAVSVLTLAAFSFAGFIAGFRLPDLPYTASREYLQTRNALWAIACLIVGGGLLRSTNWAPKFTRLSLSLIGLWFLLDRIFLTQSEYARLTLPVSATLIITGLGVMFWVLNRPESKSHFRENKV